MVKTKTAELLAQVRTDEVIETLIRLNEGLMWDQINKFGLLNDPEANSVGHEALYKAIISFDVNNSTSFSTYATVCVYNRLGSYVRTLKSIKNSNTVSYNAEVGGNGTTHLDRFESRYTADGTLLESERLEEIVSCVDECIESNSNIIQKEILYRWRDAEFNMTNKEIAAEVGCSQSYVSQTLNRFRQNLKEELK